MTQVPPQLKSVQAYFTHAKNLENVDPITSYYCRYYAVQEGIKVRSTPNDGAKKFLISQMDKLEQDKASLGDQLPLEAEALKHVMNFALKVFVMADNEDRAGKANKTTAMNFLSAAQFFDVLTQFGELLPDIQEKRKYAKWKAANITSALKQGLKPVAGPPGEAEMLAELDSLSSSQENTQNNTSIPTPPQDFNFQTTPPSIPTPSFPSFPSPPPSQSTTQPYIPPQPAAQHYTPPQPATQQYIPPQPSGTYHPTPADMELATKYAKFVVSSLQFDDAPAAIKNLKLALAVLTGNKE